MIFLITTGEQMNKHFDGGFVNNLIFMKIYIPTK